MPDPKKGGQDVLLGKYEIGRLLGRGTFAKVYHARSVADDTAVAVKVLDKKELTAARMAPLILREVDAMSRLSHPNILRLHEVMATKTKIYLVMEYAPGGELLSRLTRRLPEQTARRYFNQLLSALRFCHARGVAHRDVKPQNLLLDGEGSLKVSDFGLSALPDNLRDGRLHTSCGTPAYAAPEVLRGKPYDGTRADAWSCGVILYVLLAGKLPFDDSNLALMFRKIMKREYEFPPWFPQPAKRVVARLLDPNPETRLTLEKLTELPWLKRSYSLDNQLNLMGSVPRLDRSLTVPMMNAFDIISMSPGLDLSGLFGGGGRGVRFTSKAEVASVMERIDEMGAKLGFGVQRRKGGGGGSGRGSTEWGKVVTVDVSVVEGSMVVVEMKAEGSEDGVDWEQVKAELGDVIYEWKSNTEICEGAVNSDGVCAV